MKFPSIESNPRADATLHRVWAIPALLLLLALGACGDLFGPSHPLSLHVETEALVPGSEARLVMVNHGRREVQHRPLGCAFVERKTEEGWEVAAAWLYGCGGLSWGLRRLGGREKVELTFTISSGWAIAGETYRMNVPAFRGNRDITPYTDEFRIEAAVTPADERD
jgi:hypothetical protein